MIVLCLGLQGSASTWIFNVVRSILKNRDFVSFDSTSTVGIENYLFRHADWVVIKAHTCTGPLLNLLRHCNVKAIVSTRDPRDAAASLMGRLMPSPRDAIQNVNRAFAGVMTGTTVLDHSLYIYEERFFEKSKTVQEISNFIGASVSIKESEKILESLSFENVRKIVNDIKIKNCVVDEYIGHSYDITTRFNENHLGDTLSNKWKSAFSGDCLDDLIAMWDGQSVVRVGWATRFSESLFSEPEPYIPEHVGPGRMVLHMGFLHAVRWALAVDGCVPGARSSPAVIAHNGGIAAFGETSSKGVVRIRGVYEHRFHDQSFSVHVRSSQIAKIDPRRDKRVTLSARYLGAI